MPKTHQLIRADSSTHRPRGLTIRVAGRGLFVVMQGSHELLRGTFEQCYDYVDAARVGPIW